METTREFAEQHAHEAQEQCVKYYNAHACKFPSKRRSDCARERLKLKTYSRWQTGEILRVLSRFSLKPTGDLQKNFSKFAVFLLSLNFFQEAQKALLIPPVCPMLLPSAPAAAVRCLVTNKHRQPRYVTLVCAGAKYDCPADKVLLCTLYYLRSFCSILVIVYNSRALNGFRYGLVLLAMLRSLM